MKQCPASFWPLAAAAILSLAVVQAAEFHVSPLGRPSGPGSKAQPYDLVTVLSDPIGKPGDTFWIHEGIYPIGHLDISMHGSPGRPITFRQAPGERAQVVGSMIVEGEIGYLVFRDFELYSGEVQRLSRQTGVGFKPTDVPNHVEGVQVGAPNISFINLIVHDSVASAFYTAEEATNTLIYGCLVYNTGWASPDNAEGHSFYLQGAGEISDCVAFNTTGANFHIYANGPGWSVQNLKVEGNVAFGAGTLQQVRNYRDWIVGVDKPSTTANNIVLKSNMGYAASNATTLTQVQIGRENVNGTITLSSNYWPLGLVLNNWSSATVSGNVIAPQNSDPVVDLEQNLTKLTGRWNGNYYYSGASSREMFRVGPTCDDFGNWKKKTGYDAESTCTQGRLRGAKVFVRPNRYEAGRANIVVYNWDNSGKVAVDVRSVMSAGVPYEVRNAEDFFGPPVLTGVFDGQPLQLPMTGLSVAKPMAPFRTPAPTGPTFNVFVLLPKSK